MKCNTICYNSSTSPPPPHQKTEKLNCDAMKTNQKLISPTVHQYQYKLVKI